MTCPTSVNAVESRSVLFMASTDTIPYTERKRDMQASSLRLVEYPPYSPEGVHADPQELP